MLARGVVVHHKQDVGVALGPTGKFGQGRNVVVPHGARSHRGQELRHVAGRVLQVFFQGRTQLCLLVLQPRRQASGKALTRTGGQAVEARRDFTPSLLKFTGEFLTVRAQALTEIGFQRGHGAPGQRDRHQHLHQKGDTEGNEYGPQQTAL
ncbi:hypothetical protein D3C80_1621410 [compost metagenome]